MSQLPIRALTLYKQGIDSFQRRGTLRDPSATLMAARASLNDVLKSLDSVVHQGGPLLSVDYDHRLCPDRRRRGLGHAACEPA